MPNRNNVAIFAIDPGVTTGCAAGLFDLRQPTVAACMRRARSKRNIFSWEVYGEHTKQCWEMANWWYDWYFKTHVERSLIMADNFYIVMENFIPRQLNYDPTSLLVIGGFEVLLEGMFTKMGKLATYNKQEPSERWADYKWLKENGIWTSSDHEKDARRHIGTKLDKLL